MIKKIVDWFSAENNETRPEISVNLAAAALLVEVMAADSEWHADEENTVRGLLSDTLQLSPAEAEELVQAAKQHHDATHDLFEITKRINEAFSPEKKFQLVKGMWQVAYADGNLDRYEDHIIRRVAELIYVPHNQFIRAKLEAKPE